MLDFSRGAKGRSDPLANAEAAREFVAALKQEYGAAAHERVVALLTPLEWIGTILQWTASKRC